MEKPFPEEWESLGSNCVLSAWNEISIKNGIEKDMYLLAYILYILDQLSFWMIFHFYCFEQ